ncbi:Inorganic triphosphatase [compost metagenome]
MDEFLGENAGLVVAEVELEHADQAITLPGWAGAEVTDQVRYYNLALAAHPFSRWSSAERG